MIFILAPILTYWLGNTIDNLFELPKIPTIPWNFITGLPVLFVGVFIGVKATRLLYYKGEGLPWGGIESSVKSRNLVTNGPYSYCRNPMVLGYTMLPVGMGIIFMSIGMFFFIPSFVLTYNIILLKCKEEPSLKERFGTEYLEYKENVPFLLPNISKMFKDLLKFKNEV